MTIGILLAAGNSTRFNGRHSKQLTKLGDQKVLEYSLKVFDSHSEINEIVVVTQSDLIRIVTDLVNDSFPKVTKVIKGGESRSQSSLNALENINASGNTKILFHDAARPFVDTEMITNCINALDSYDAVTTAIPSSDTLLEISTNEVLSIPKRENYMHAQTPQGFRFEVIKKAYEFLKTNNNFAPTDDCGIVQKFLPDTPIGVVTGSESNIKLTYPNDLYLAEIILKQKSN